MSVRLLFVTSGTISALLVAAADSWAQNAPRPKTEDTGQVLREPVIDIDRSLIDDTQPGRGRPVTVNMSRKWIGVLCQDVDETLRRHINIPEDTGLVVQQVVPDSPAAAAGLKPHDILLEADGQPIAGVHDLIEAVGGAQDDGLKLTWLHRGEEVTQTIQPTDRPDAVSLPWTVGSDEGSALESDALNQWLEALRQGQTGKLRGPMQLRFFGPGIKIPPGTPDELPTDLRVEICKEGKEPAKITVQKGNHKWELTEDALDQLPDDVRPHVEGMLGRGTGRWNLPMQLPQFSLPQDLEDVVPWPQMEQRFDEMNRRMEKMLEELRQLRGGEAEEDEAPEFNPDTDA